LSGTALWHFIAIFCGTSLQFKDREEREQTFDLKIADTLFGCFTTNDAQKNN